MHGMNLFLMWVGLTIGNFICMMFVPVDAGTIADRSFFQGVALFCVYMVPRWGPLGQSLSQWFKGLFKRHPRNDEPVDVKGVD